MSRRFAIAANGDTDLLDPTKTFGRFTIGWTALGGATVVLKARMEDEAFAMTTPIQNGKLTAALTDSQGTTISCMNIEVCCERVVATVTGFTAPFSLWTAEV